MSYRLSILLQTLKTVRALANVVRLKEAVQLVTSLEVQQAAGLVRDQGTGTVPLDSQSLEGGSSRVLAVRGKRAAGSVGMRRPKLF